MTASQRGHARRASRAHDFIRAPTSYPPRRCTRIHTMLITTSHTAYRYRYQKSHLTHITLTVLCFHTASTQLPPSFHPASTQLPTSYRIVFPHSLPVSPKPSYPSYPYCVSKHFTCEPMRKRCSNPAQYLPASMPCPSRRPRGARPQDPGRYTAAARGPQRCLAHMWNKQG